ncbi:MAG: hypothetical protein ABH851_06455 [Methanobacteriota archaeon]
MKDWTNSQKKELWKLKELQGFENPKMNKIKVYIVVLVLISFTLVQVGATIPIQSQSNTWKFFSGLMALMIPLLEWEMDLLLGFIIMNPTIYCWDSTGNCEVSAGIDALLPYFTSILIPLYISAVLFTALYYIVKSTNPRGRARAKAMLSKLLFSMILVAMAPIIYQTLLDLSSALVDAVYNSNATTLGDLNTMTEAATGGEIFGVCCVFIIMLSILGWTLIMALLRYFFVVAYAAVFPILIFLYFFDLTRSWGRKYIKEAVNWIFTPVVQILWLVFTLSAMNSVGPMLIHWQPAVFGPPIMGAIISWGMTMVGLVMVGATPLTMNHLMNMVGGGIFAAGLASNNTWITGLGGLLQGRQDAALHAAKSVLTRAIPEASMIAGLQSGGYGAGLGRPGGAFSPSTVSRLSGGAVGGAGPAEGDAGAGFSSPGSPKRGGGKKHKDAGDAAKREVEAMRDQAEGPTESDWSAGKAPARSDRYEGAADRSLQAHMKEDTTGRVLPQMRGSKGKRYGASGETYGASGERVSSAPAGEGGVRQSKTSFPIARSLNPVSPNVGPIKGREGTKFDEMKKEAENQVDEAKKDAERRVGEAKKDITRGKALRSMERLRERASEESDLLREKKKKPQKTPKKKK